MNSSKLVVELEEEMSGGEEMAGDDVVDLEERREPVVELEEARRR